MLTHELLRREMRESERLEEQMYMNLTLALLNQLQMPLRDLYNTMFAATHGLRAISAEAIQNHPRIIKMLRYATAPSISQMRLGQIAGLGTTSGFEEKGIVPTFDQAERLARWFSEHLDRERFPWIDPDTSLLSAAELNVAERYAMLWTVSLIGNQNTATAYRTRRKQLQEAAIAQALERAGLSEQRGLGSSVNRPRISRSTLATPQSPRQGGISSADDIRPGHFVREQKLLFGKRQKADLTARPGAGEKLVCVEAKAVGIRIDSTKRLKELNDKHTDWIGSGLNIMAVGVCAGFFNDIELIATARGRGIPIFWEHNLDQLIAFVSQDYYYGSPWNARELFPDVPDVLVRVGLESIQEAPKSIAEEREAYTSESEPDEF